MKTVAYLTALRELSEWKSASVHELIIATKEFSRRGTLTLDEGLELAAQASAQGFALSFEWDALMEEPRFIALTRRLEALPFTFKSVRVRDAGAALWVRDHLTAEIHLLLEAGHHNLLALKSWHQRLGDRLGRVVVSPELPAKTLKAWAEEFPVPLEVLGLGPLLLFHSPRALLSKLASAPEGEEWIAEGASEESPHKGFPLYESAHGTLMFHPKDLSILERWSEIPAAGVEFLRLDHRHETRAAVVPELAAFLRWPGEESLALLKANWSRDWMRGYWDVNKSDVLFDRLTNAHLQQRDLWCGEVIEGKKEAWLAVRGRGAGLRRGSEIEVISPLGKARSLKLHWLKDDAFQDVEELSDGDVGFVPWSPGSPSKSQLRLLRPAASHSSSVDDR